MIANAGNTDGTVTGKLDIPGLVVGEYVVNVANICKLQQDDWVPNVTPETASFNSFLMIPQIYGTHCSVKIYIDI